jgi:pyruvate/2-oxoglutarate dehydrogenase complex dihydrolipoamide acyltransferase (E2) component
MAEIAIRIPKLGMDTTEAVISKWLVEEGSLLVVGTPLVELESEKVTFAYESEFAGKLVRILVGDGETVPVGEIVAMAESD